MTNERALAPINPNVFLTFDRLDDDQIVAEMKGAALNTYVYEFTQQGQTVRGLSKTGTDDAARIMAVKYGEALREVDCWLEREDEEAAYFKAKVARFTIRDDGTSIELDAAIGHKRQPKRMPKGAPNPFWYEQGGQKALRNAKQKLMPETIKQAIIAMYVREGKVQKVRQEDVEDRSRPARPTPTTVNMETGKIVDPEPRPAPELPPADGMSGIASLEQARAIYSLGARSNMSRDELVAYCKERYDGKTPDFLTKTEAGQLIKSLQAGFPS